MAIFYPDILDQQTAARTFTYGDKDVMLYALGVGMSHDPMDETRAGLYLRKGPEGDPDGGDRAVRRPCGRPARGADQVEQKRRGTGPASDQLPDGRARRTEGRVAQAAAERRGPSPLRAARSAPIDKGKDKGAVIVNEDRLGPTRPGEKVATLTGSTFARGDGGFGGPSEGQPEPHASARTSKPDLSVDISTREDQALLYRLNGDRNPLHSDPESARRSGFPRPILHGLCTYGITCRAVLQAITGLSTPTRSSATRRGSPRPSSPETPSPSTSGSDGKEISFEAQGCRRATPP